jgi:putative oxidoreductase
VSAKNEWYKLHVPSKNLDYPKKGFNQEVILLHVKTFITASFFYFFVTKFQFIIQTVIMKKLINWFTNPPVNGPSAILLLRLMAGGVFFWEGILKFVYVNQGVGRFTKLGFPFPESTAHLVAVTEIIGGLFLLFGIFTRFVAFYFIIEMIVAILATKISVYLGTSPLPLPPAPPKTGFWAVLHEIRSDYAQLLTCLFLFIEGAGKRSIDALLKRNK